MVSSQHTCATQGAAALKARCVAASATSWPSTPSLQQLVQLSVSLNHLYSTTGTQKRKGAAARKPSFSRGFPCRTFYELAPGGLLRRAPDVVSYGRCLFRAATRE